MPMVLYLPTCYFAPWMCQHFKPIFQLKKVSVPVARFFKTSLLMNSLMLSVTSWTLFWLTTISPLMASITSKCSVPAWVPRWHPAWLAFSWVVLKKPCCPRSPRSPLMWTRYIDDVFCLWPHGPDDSDHFVNFCNSFHPTIKFTSESSAMEIPLLDVMVSIKDGQLHTDLYSKPTDAQQFLHWTSCHPKHRKTSLPYGLAFLLNHICSSQESLQMRITELERCLKARGYPSSIIKRQISKALEIPRSDALEPRATRSNNTDRIPLVITYHPSLPKLSQILNKHLRILHSSDKCKKAIPNIPKGCVSQKFQCQRHGCPVYPATRSSAS